MRAPGQSCWDTKSSASGTRANAAFIFNGEYRDGHEWQACWRRAAARSSCRTRDPHRPHETQRSEAPRRSGYGLRACWRACIIDRWFIDHRDRDAPASYVSNGAIVATNVVVKTHGKDISMGVPADLNGQITLEWRIVTTTGDAIRQSSFTHGLPHATPAAY